MVKLGRTHETLVEADQPRLPVVVENHNRLNHLRRSRFSQHRRLPASTNFRHHTDTSGWCSAESSRRKTCPGAQGTEGKESAFPARRGERFQGGQTDSLAEGWCGHRGWGRSSPGQDARALVCVLPDPPLVAESRAQSHARRKSRPKENNTNGPGGAPLLYRLC